MPGVIEVPTGLLARMVEHARAEMPHEAVGLLGGNEEGRVGILAPLANVGPPRTFLANPRSQFLAERDLARAGATLLAIYHSHPGGGTDPSPLDLVFARERSCAYVVLAVDPPGRSGEELRAYEVRGDGVEEVTIRITGGP